MKKLILILLVSPSLLWARDFNGRWAGCLVSHGGHGLGRCTVELTIQQTATTFHVSDRVYKCNTNAGVKELAFRPIALDVGNEITTTKGQEIPFLDQGAIVGGYEVNGRYGKIDRTPDGSRIQEMYFSNFHPNGIVWSECFDLAPGKPECIYGALSPRP